MKRTLALALACALSLSLLSACGGTGGNGSSASDISAASGQPGSDSSASSPTRPDGSLPDVSVPDPSDSSSAPAAGLPAQNGPSLTLNRTDFTLKSVGASFRLKYTCEPDIDAIPEFSSSDEAVAAVSEDGTVTAVSPGTATITLQYGSLTVSCIVRCRWDTEPSGSASSTGSSDSSSSAARVDLSAFYASVSGAYEFPSFMELADREIQDAFYPGLSDVATEQCLVYANMMSMNMGEFVLVQVTNSRDVDTVKAILQDRIDNMVSGGAWYPEPTELWTNASTVVSNGNYVMMVVHEDYSAIVQEFNALF